jgi:hypothetical protein
VNVAEIDDQKGIVKPVIEEQEIAEPEAVIDQQP